MHKINYHKDVEKLKKEKEEADQKLAESAKLALQKSTLLEEQIAKAKLKQLKKQQLKLK